MELTPEERRAFMKEKERIENENSRNPQKPLP